MVVLVNYWFTSLLLHLISLLMSIKNPRMVRRS